MGNFQVDYQKQFTHAILQILIISFSFFLFLSKQIDFDIRLFW